MQPGELTKTLERYKEELEGFLSRFKKTRDSIHIDRQDDARFREIALELRDLVRRRICGWTAILATTHLVF